MPVNNAADPLTPGDIRDAGVLANAAYGESAAGDPISAVESLVGSGWSYVHPADLGIAAQYIDAQGFLSVKETVPAGGITVDVQVLLARKGGTLAVAFRGTSSFTDLINDVLGAVGGFGQIYAGVAPLIDTILGSAASVLATTKILVAGHSLGGAMAEEMLARHPADVRLVGVTFGSPGINDGDLVDAPGTDPRLINIGHVDLDEPLFLNPLTVVGDAIFRQTPFEYEWGSNIRVWLPDEPEMNLVETALSYLAGNGTGQHRSPLYVDTAVAMTRQGELIQALGLPTSVRDYGFLRGTAPGGSVLVGSNAINVLIGGAAADTLAGLGGSDIVDGAGGSDMADYALDAANGGAAAVYVDLGAGIAVDGFGDIDKLVDVESVRGSNALVAADGSWADVLVGSEGDNLFLGLAGGDMIDGRGGVDTVSYADDAQFGGGSGVFIDLALGIGFDGFGAGDLLISIENVIGTDGASDAIHGDDADNRLEGRGGGDVLEGRGGNDVLVGGDGDDTLDGGAGNDAFDGGGGRNSMTGGAGRDAFLVQRSDNAIATILDFDPAEDLLVVDRAIYSALVGDDFGAIGGAITLVSGGFRLAAPSFDVTVLGGATVDDLLPRLSPSG